MAEGLLEDYLEGTVRFRDETDGVAPGAALFDRELTLDELQALSELVDIDGVEARIEQ